MFYCLVILNVVMLGKKVYDYKLGGNLCLVGDVIDVYSFDELLNIGDCLQFEDMMYYIMVKIMFFNGVEYLLIGILCSDDIFELVCQFDYSDFKGKLF